jgi:hypothetical protein
MKQRRITITSAGDAAASAPAKHVEQTQAA